MLPVYFMSANQLSYSIQNKDLIVAGKTPYNKMYRLNRCVLASAQGPLILTVPLLHGRNQRALLNQIKLDDRSKWRREHINSIRTVYGKAPFFLYYADSIFEIINREEAYLLTYNVTIINRIFDLIHYPGRVSIAEEELPTVRDKANLSNQIRYHQIFESKTGFISDCSILDVLFNYGPESLNILMK